jgi:nicotinamide-nucleotide amidase
VKAEIIASGTELLLGEISDTNSSFLASQLPILGIDLYYASIVGDNFERFSNVLKQALSRSDLILITGGLGPTQGDITREVIAAALGEKMEIDENLKRQISEFFARMRLEMTQNNLKQATLIPSATAIPNPLGTAPGWWVETGSRIVVAMPGPPGEMQPMWKKQVFPRLEKRAGAVILSRNLKTWGISEAKVDQMVSKFMNLPNPTLALYAKPDGIRLRITAKAGSSNEALALINSREQQLRAILKDSIWGIDDEKLEESTGRLLEEKGLRLAVAESFTNGLLTSTLAAASGSPGFFSGGLVFADARSREMLELPDSAGPRSLESAARMAAYAREKFAADIGIGIDGRVNGLDASQQTQAFVAFDFARKERNFVQTYPGRSAQLMRRSVMQVVFELRRLVLTL